MARSLRRSTTRSWCVAMLAVVTAAYTAILRADDLPRPSAPTRAEVFRQVREMTEIGRRMFSDPALSASGTIACASCHSPAHAYAPPNALAVQPGGLDSKPSGFRAAPGLTYLQATPQFSEHFHESSDEGDESIDAGPTGGLTWDGRVDRGRAQALIPLFSPTEMGNTNRAAVAAVIAERYGAALRQALRVELANPPDVMLDAGLKALEIFEQDAAAFFPYTSKYDAWLGGKTTLTAQETRGLQLFNDEAKGNCASCHVSMPGKDGTPPQFTDYGLIAIGVPRNASIATNNDADFHDLGLCGPLRGDLKNRPEYCGLFKTPSLRNVAVRQSFFHNGVFHSLKQAVEFYVTRDTDPAKWYARNTDGSVRKFDDLPAQYRANINVDPPFDRRLGDKPALDANEIDDLVAFLGTLTDGYRAKQR